MALANINKREFFLIPVGNDRKLLSYSEVYAENKKSRLLDSTHKVSFWRKKSPQNTYNLMKSKVVYKNGIFVAFLVVIYFVLYRIALWVCFGDAIVQGTGSKFVPQNSPKIQFDATPSCWSPVQPGNGRFKRGHLYQQPFRSPSGCWDFGTKCASLVNLVK